MSAGICIMNKNAIALAADSAVTIGQHLAIHNSAMTSAELKHRAKLQEWAARIQDCRSSGLSVRAWLLPEYD